MILRLDSVLFDTVRASDFAHNARIIIEIDSKRIKCK